MPEGDTIHRTAARLRSALVGRALRRVELTGQRAAGPAVGATVTGVEARGKHLLIHTDDGLALHTHLRMSGSWHLYRPGQRWQRSPRAARVVLATTEVVAVCFSAPVVEVLDRGALDRHPSLRRLGPDLCDPATSPADAARRMRALSEPARPVGEALLDQRAACGVGNVYRAEVCFLHGLDPAAAIATVDDATLAAMLSTATELLQANLATTARTTTGADASGRLWVYGRAGRPCRRCGTTIVRERLGEHARIVDRCPTCQPRHGGQ